MKGSIMRNQVAASGFPALAGGSPLGGSGCAVGTGETSFASERREEGALHLPSPFPLDMGRILVDLNTSFNPLHPEFMLDYHVSEAREGYVYLSIALPEGMTKAFMTFLESMCGFFHFIDIKARSAVAVDKAVNHADLAERQKAQDLFRLQVCDLFDSFTSQGIDTKSAVRLTNASLKAKNHPWASHAVILDVLRSAGKFRTRKGGK